jgi:hypothetical protein
MTYLPTKERLAQAMEASACPPSMIRRTRDGYYDDFESQLITPALALVADLRAIGQHALAVRAVQGEFDGTTAEGDAWASSVDGQAAFRDLLEGR